MSGYIGNIPTPQATQTRDTFTATASQTTFATSGYTPSFLDVFLNGVHLVNGTDYTATNGSDVVLTSGAAAGDTLEVVSYSTFEVNSQTFTGTTTLTGDLQATTATFSGAVTGTDATLSGGVYLGGTGAANYLEDYETGYFEPNIQPTSGSITWNTSQNKLSYTKIGRLVHITGQLAVSSISSPSGITRGSLPFTQLDQDEQSERTTGVVLVQNTSLNVNEFGIYPNGGSDTFLEIVRTNATGVQRDAGSYFTSSTVIQVNYTYVVV